VVLLVFMHYNLKVVLLKSSKSGIACLYPLLSNKMVLLKSGISGIACFSHYYLKSGIIKVRYKWYCLFLAIII